ncbi:papain [Sesbania bispinosa]|nr:papain [Sesbania bispinosa]
MMDLRCLLYHQMKPVGHEPIVERASSSKKPAQSKKTNDGRKKLPIRKSSNKNGGDSHNASSSRSVDVVAEEGIQHHELEDGYNSEELVIDFNDSESDEDNRPTYGTGIQTIAATQPPPATQTPTATQNDVATQSPTATQTPTATPTAGATNPPAATQPAAAKQPST